MTKQKSQAGQNRQSAGPTEEKSDTGNDNARRGKEAASHTKAGTGKGAGGGKKQGRKH
ncbi:hypothetical protein [Janthinobacterium sp. FW305-128]|uniref:hypothetical protein n=1 Tax=Janthinobacterium sp. FW305-128 TaxID=2775055 RepID=UPI001E330368|nr:hypothetical protein [Janthinobacterium sp. FW305-128]MCC7681562.1 hypothetical protein [Janthinobacterium sp. FW305-128]